MSNGKRRLVFRQTNSAVEAVDEIQSSTALIGEHGPQIVDGASETTPLPKHNSAVRRLSASARSTRAPSFVSPLWASFARADLGGRIGDLRGIPDGAERERGGAVEAGVVPECALL